MWWKYEVTIERETRMYEYMRTERIIHTDHITRSVHPTHMCSDCVLTRTVGRTRAAQYVHSNGCT